MKDNRFSRYAGSKLHFCNRLNTIAKELKGSTTYVEPFFGSGAIFFNLDREFDRYVLNDTNRHVVNTVASFKHGTYEQYRRQIDYVAEKFGDIMKEKESYYKFRDWFNVEYFGKGRAGRGILLSLPDELLHQLPGEDRPERVQPVVRQQVLHSDEARV